MPDLRIENKNGLTQVFLPDRLDEKNVSYVNETILAELAKASNFIFFLQETTYLNSVALRYLLDWQQIAKDNGGGVVLMNPSLKAKRILEIVGYDQLLPIVYSDLSVDIMSMAAGDKAAH